MTTVTVDVTVHVHVHGRSGFDAALAEVDRLLAGIRRRTQPGPVEPVENAAPEIVSGEAETREGSDVALDVRASPDTTPDATSTPGDRRLGKAQRQVLTYLADRSGRVTDATGAAAGELARAIGLQVNHASTVLKKLEGEGLVEREIRGKRTFAIALTDTGRRAISREHTNQSGFTNVATRARVTPDPGAPPPVMPDAGPMTRTPFDPEAARLRAADHA